LYIYIYKYIANTQLMSPLGPPPTAFQGEPSLANWGVHVQAELKGCNQWRTDAQAKRLAKTLQRLYPAATAAMDQVRQAGFMPGAYGHSATFSATLMALSDG
jgi:hypothetical protein